MTGSVWATPANVTIVQNKYLASIAALRLISHAAYTAAYVLGYYTPGDGGGGNYWYDATDVTSADNGGSVIVDTAGGRWKLVSSGKISIKQFGAKCDSAADDTAKIVAAVAYMSALGGGIVEIPFAGFSVTSSTLLIPANITLIGAGKRASGIIVSADVVGIRATGANVELKAFQVTKTGAHTKNGIEIGDLTHDARQAVIDSVYVAGMGNDGIQIRQGNLGTIRDVSCVSNTRHGIKATIETPDTNAWTMCGIVEVTSNGGKGFYLEEGSSVSDAYASRSWTADLVVAQNNIGFGIDIGTRSNTLTFYGELNGVRQCSLGTYAAGNVITSVEGAVYDTTPANNNLILNGNANASYWREFQGKTLFGGGLNNGLRVSNSDGTAGYVDHEKIGARDYRVKLSGSAAAWTYKVENTSAGQIIDGYFGGYWSPITDNAYDLGKPALRWANVYTTILRAGMAKFTDLPTAGSGSMLSMGAQYSASATAGAGPALPATVEGFLLAYIGAVQVKVPYYLA